MSSNEALWEQHAAWWQREFTNGRDAEYEELILPLVADTGGFEEAATIPRLLLVSARRRPSGGATETPSPGRYV